MVQGQPLHDYLAQEGLQQLEMTSDAMGREAAFRDAQAAFDRDRQTGLDRTWAVCWVSGPT